jgi:hypothetical protein
MWKVALGFVVFAALALFLLSKGPDIDMGGEKHGSEMAPAPNATPATSAAPAAEASAVKSGSPY